MQELDDLLFDPDLAPAKATKPATRWRNKWRALEMGMNSITRQIITPGEVYWGRSCFPSKDAAETAAAEDALNRATCDSVYLGAFPEGESP